MSDKRTAIFVVLDGLGDRPLKELGGKTPLEYAKTPTFDRLAAEGQSRGTERSDECDWTRYHTWF
jgi:2,3-bisphosphoglycerate-independent phosphoglycerate mutase